MPSKIRAAADCWQPAIDHLKAVDARWRARLDSLGPCQLRPHRDRFALLVRSIVSQQISTKAAKSIHDRVLALQDGAHDPARLASLTDAALRGAGLSTMKVRYVRSLADEVASGRLPLKQAGRWSDEEVIERLTKVHGIGRWTAEMFLIFALNRPDVFSAGDLGIRAGMKRHFEMAEMPDQKTCVALAETWRPHRTVAVWYLWREIDAPPPAAAAEVSLW